jgi:hypothetical protein
VFVELDKVSKFDTRDPNLAANSFSLVELWLASHDGTNEFQKHQKFKAIGRLFVEKEWQ